MRLILLNAAVMPQAGTYRIKQIGAQAFIDVLGVAQGNFISFIGYPDTAEMISQMTGMEVPVSREQTYLKNGDRLLICKLRYRVANPAEKGRTHPEPEDFEFFLGEYEAIDAAAELAARVEALEASDRAKARLLDVAHDHWQQAFDLAQERGAEVVRWARRVEALERALGSGEAFLARIDNITTDSFGKGGDRDAREAFRAAIADAKEASK